MPNLFRSYTASTSVVINEMYDLKGSIDARYVDVDGVGKTKLKKEKRNKRRQERRDRKERERIKSGGVRMAASGSGSEVSSDESTDDEAGGVGGVKDKSSEWDVISNILKDTKIRLTYEANKGSRSDGIVKSAANDKAAQSDSSTGGNTADAAGGVEGGCLEDSSTGAQVVDSPIKTSGLVLKDLNFCPFHGTMHASLCKELPSSDASGGDASSPDDSSVGGASVGVEEDYSITGLHIRSKFKQVIGSPRSPSSQSRRMSATGAHCRKLRLGEDRRAVFLANLRNDTAWLRENNIMDYSLLLGVGTCQVKQVEEEKIRQSLLNPSSSSSSFQQAIDSTSTIRDDDSDDDDDDDELTIAEENRTGQIRESIIISQDDKNSYWERECGGVCATSLETNERVSILKDSYGVHSVPIGLPGEEHVTTIQDDQPNEREW